MTEKQRKERFYENHLQALGTVSVPVHALRPSGLLRRAIRLFRSVGDHPRPDRVLRRRGESLSRHGHHNPDAILVIDRETKPAADTIQGLLDNPALQEVTAIKNQNFYTITHVSFYCGSMQTIEDIEGLSEMLHK